MTSPTGPHCDRLRACEGGQETCGCGHPVTDHDTDRFSDEGCRHGWGPGLVRFGAAGCMCTRFRPAPQQPPVQEREVHVCCVPELRAGPASICSRCRDLPPSEADSAGEEKRALFELLRFCAGDLEEWAESLYESGVRLLAASSGVRGGGMGKVEREARRWLQLELEEGDYHTVSAIRWALVRIAELEASAQAAEPLMRSLPADTEDVADDSPGSPVGTSPPDVLLSEPIDLRSKLGKEVESAGGVGSGALGRDGADDHRVGVVASGGVTEGHAEIVSGNPDTCQANLTAVVRGGDDQARERLADVLDTCDVLDRVSDADDMTGRFGRDAARIRRAAVETIRLAAGGGQP